MSEGGVGHAGHQQEAIERLRIAAPAPILEEIRRSRVMANRRFRILFAVTWVIVVGALAAGLWAAGKIDPEFIGTWAPFILGGIGITIFVSVVSILVAIVFAIFGALGRLSRRAPLYAVATLYVSLVRGTPLLVQVYFVFLALPQIHPAFAAVPTVVLGILALAFNYGAYMTEIFRAGIQAVPRGQIEAAQALGMTERQIMVRVVLPQAVRIVIPAIGNEFIAMIKDSSLVSVMGVQELLWRSRTSGQQHFRSLETFLIAALVYWILTIIFSLFQDRLERRMAESEVRI